MNLIESIDKTAKSTGAFDSIDYSVYCIGRPESPNMQGGGQIWQVSLHHYTSECCHDVWCRKTTLSEEHDHIFDDKFK